jgi:CHAT domain-containing protein/Flp pilus assembly protein TadD
MASITCRTLIRVVAVAFLLSSSAVCGAASRETLLAESERIGARIEALFGQGRLGEAIPLARRLVELCEAIEGPEAECMGVTLNLLARAYSEAGRFTEEQPLLLRALALDEKARGPDHPTTLITVGNLAVHYLNTGAYSKARPLLERVLASREKTLPTGSPDIALALNNLGQFYDRIGAFAKAEALLLRALEIYEGLPAEEQRTAMVLGNLGVHHASASNPSKAEPYFLRALAIREKTGGPRHPDVAGSLNNLAKVAEAVGDVSKAESLLQRALGIWESTVGPEHPSTALAVGNLGYLYLDAGEFSKAEALLKRALAINEKTFGPKHPDTAISLGGLASIYLRTGALYAPGSLLQRAIAIDEEVLGPNAPALADHLSALAEVHLARGALDAARPLAVRALAIRENAFGPESLPVAVSLNNLGRVADALGAADTEPLLARALSIATKTEGQDGSMTGTILNNLGLHYQVVGESDKAEVAFLRALAIHDKRTGPKSRDSLITVNNLSAIYAARGDATKAEPMFERAQNIEEEDTLHFIFSGSELRKRGYLEGRRLNVYAATTFAMSSHTPRSARIAMSGVLQIKGRVVDAMSTIFAKARDSKLPQDSALLNRLADVARDWSYLRFHGPERISPEEYGSRLKALADEQERLQNELADRNLVLRSEVEPIRLDGVHVAIPEHAVLLEFFRYRPFAIAVHEKDRYGEFRYAVFLLRRDAEPLAIDLGAAAVIDSLVGEFREALGDPSSSRIKPLSVAVSARLVGPWLDQIGSRRQILISPDGALSLLPFSALVDPQGEFLVRRFDISYLTSGRDLLHLASASAPRSGAALFADPDYGIAPMTPFQTAASRSTEMDRSGLQFRRLSGTATEARMLQGLLKVEARRVFTGSRATETALKGLRGPRLLHVATHGFYLTDRDAGFVRRSLGIEDRFVPALTPLGESPLLRSGLALAGANARGGGDGDDGILTAAEVAQLDFEGTQLVVLSACETGVGEVQTGEGVFGLRRALAMAGARTQVTSLWKVSDAATQELMAGYYGKLLKGAGRAAGLREAQLAMLSRPSRRHPYFWAAFIAIGDWTPLPPDR